MSADDLVVDDFIPLRWGISSAHVNLLPPDEDQDAAMSRILSDSEAMKFLQFMTKPNGYSPADVAKRRQYRDQSQRNKKLLNFTIALKQSQIPDQLLDKIDQEEFLPPRRIPVDGISGCIDMDESYLVIGCCGLNNIEGYNRCSEAGILLDARFWRSGVSSAAMYLVLKYGFETMHLHRIALLTTEDNIGMRGWLERAVGVSVECVRREVLYLGSGKYLDSWDYAVFDRHWHEHAERKLLSRLGALKQ
ncbi:hypothetical protein LPJ66_000016 [Kickxella alabastrina]|uniref:Uncharacterized protein n=1 Tax=Kickxella alabastrina TaxID=61397 RepID=A0ACC1IX64_9FUNG|nr:hypothetical protein LPJ66_000016 [Kickxella alabastrina]